jgi:acetyl-CoA/propionyl-CoA carboxylase biotin carboxyl carrier protein
MTEVNGKRFEVVVHSEEEQNRRHKIKSNVLSGNSGNTLNSPMQGTVVKILRANGERVKAGDLIVVLEAMKMEQPLLAHRDGIIEKLTVGVGQTVTSGATLCVIEDAD